MTVYTGDNNNRLNPPANPSPMVYDATDKLVTWPGQHRYTYYPTGSLYHQKDSQGSVQKTFAYTGAELLSSVTHAGVANPSLMEWDADSNRVSFTSSTGGTTEFVYDTTAGIPAVIKELHGGTPVYYIREPGGELIARMASGNKQYYHFDELGSTRLLTNDSGTVTDTYTYDAWGKQTASTGSTAQPYRYVGRLGYYSHYEDENLFDDEYPTDPQFLQLGVRFYDAPAGRFTQRDSLPTESTSVYAYAQDNAMALVDPSGRHPLLVAVCAIAVRTAKPCYDCIKRVQSIGDSSIKLWMTRRGYGDVSNTGDKSTNQMNAVAHCVRACYAVSYCPKECGPLGGVKTYLNSIYEIFGTPTEGRMDRHNNDEGFSCANTTMACAQCCIKKLKNGQLSVLDPPSSGRRW